MTSLHNARTSAWCLLVASGLAMGAFLTADDNTTAAALAVAAVLLGWASASERGEWLAREQHEAEGAALDVWRAVWT